MIAQIVALATFSAAVLGTTVTVSGSDTMLILNQRWAEAYAKANPNVTVAVAGGGTGLGIKDFIHGAADIAAASRNMEKAEVDAARNNGVVAYEIPVALDGLAIAVNRSNPIESLTVDQVRRIYVGQIANWKQLGGPDEPVFVFGRDANSGTHAFFQRRVLRFQNWGPQVRFLASTSEEAKEVSRTKGGIAYGGVAYFKNNPNLKILPISAGKNMPAVLPTEDNVRSKRYPIWRHLYFYTNGRPKGAVAQFVKWVLSDEGQRIAEEVGYYSLKKLDATGSKSGG